MSVGSSAEMHARPHVSQHRVTVSSFDGTFIHYDGASTWKGDSGGALLFEEGCVVGLHLEVIDDKPTLESPKLSPRAGGGAKRLRGACGEPASHADVELASRADVEPASRADVAAVAAAVVRVDSDVSAISKALGQVSLAASSQAKVCRALLLSHPAVLEAVERARVAA